MFGERETLLAGVELEQRIGNNLWFSHDIAIADNVTFAPGEVMEVPILIPFDVLPFPDFDAQMFAAISAHTRSRYAQIGLEVLPWAGTNIRDTIFDFAGLSKKPISAAAINVANNSLRPISLSRGERFFNLYYWSHRYLTGSSLKSLIGDDIRISGREGEDWKWYIPEQSGEIEAIEFRLDPEQRRWIPQSDNPMVISDQNLPRHNRRRSIDISLARYHKFQEEEYFGSVRPPQQYY